MRGHKREYPPLTTEQRELIEDHYKDIQRIRNTLWRDEFRSSFPEVRMDWDDFDSIVNKAVCENVGNWDKNKLDFGKFIWLVIQNKARSEVKRQKRLKRASQTYASSLYKRISDENETELIDLIEGEAGVEEKMKSDMVGEVFSKLNKFEKRMMRLLMYGYTEAEICEALHCKPKHIEAVKNYTYQSVEIISIARQYTEEGNNNEL